MSKRKATTQKKRTTKKRRLAALPGEAESGVLTKTLQKELKFRCSLPDVAGDVINNAWASTDNYHLLNGLDDGDEMYNRTGRKVAMQWLRVRIQIFPNLTAATADWAKIAIVYDRQPNGLSPASWADIFQSISPTGTSSSTSMDWQNRDTTSRYFVLREWNVALPGTLTTGVLFGNSPDGNKDIYHKEWKIPLNNLMAHYNNQSTTTITSISTGALYLVQNGLNATGGYSFRATSMLAYYDL